MKTYWDYSEKERSEMSRDDVSKLIDFELMTAGVLKPVSPKLTEVESVPVGGKVKFYGIRAKGNYGSDENLGICFATIDEANKFMELNPLVRDYDYEVGSEFAYVKPVADRSIMVDELYTLEQINQFRSQLKQRKAATEENQKLTSKFNEESSKADNATKGVWSDWYSCQSKQRKLSGIVATFKEYSNMTGDSQMALKFLRKAHALGDIVEARAWFTDEIPAERDGF